MSNNKKNALGKRKDREADSGGLVFGGGSNTKQPSYEDVKAYLNLVQIGGSYVQLDHEASKVKVFSKVELKNTFEAYKYYELDEKGKMVGKSFIGKWLNDEQRLPYYSGDEATRAHYEKGEVFPPPRKPPNAGTFNFWQPFPVESIELSFTRGNVEKLYYFLNHLNMLFKYKPEAFNFNIDWFAQAFQFPANKVGIMLCLVGDKGIGKTSVWDMICNMAKEEKCFETDEPEGNITGKGNGPMLSSYFVRIKETNRQKMTKNLGALRGVITDKIIPVRSLYQGQININSYHRFFLDTNYPDAIPITKGERRFAVIDCSDAKKGDADYFVKLHECIEDLGVQRLFYEFLIRRDVKEMFQEQDIPHSRLAREIQECYLPQEEEFVKDLITTKYEDGENEKEFFLTKHQLKERFDEWKVRGGHYDRSETQLSRSLGLQKIPGVDTSKLKWFQNGNGTSYQARVTIFQNLDLRKKYNIGQSTELNEGLQEYATTDPESPSVPVDCKKLIEKTFPEIDFEWSTEWPAGLPSTSSADSGDKEYENDEDAPEDPTEDVLEEEEDEDEEEDEEEEEDEDEDDDEISG